MMKHLRSYPVASFSERQAKAEASHEKTWRRRPAGGVQWEGSLRPGCTPPEAKKKFGDG